MKTTIEISRSQTETVSFLLTNQEVSWQLNTYDKTKLGLWLPVFLTQSHILVLMLYSPQEL